MFKSNWLKPKFSSLTKIQVNGRQNKFGLGCSCGLLRIVHACIVLNGKNCRTVVAVKNLNISNIYQIYRLTWIPWICFCFIVLLLLFSVYSLLPVDYFRWGSLMCSLLWDTIRGWRHTSCESQRVVHFMLRDLSLDTRRLCTCNRFFSTINER